ncbi:MAG: hypothetical protein GXO07_02625 [Crenarchaeota archaeon]|nr:hypothetical protein [Thermoproteota archaeon]
MGRGGAGEAGLKGGGLAVELALAGLALLALIFFIAAKALQPPAEAGPAVEASVREMRLCVNRTGVIRFDVVPDGYTHMAVSVTGAGDGLSVAFPVPGPAGPFEMAVTAVNPGNYTLTVSVTLLGRGEVWTKTIPISVSVTNCTTSS